MLVTTEVTLVLVLNAYDNDAYTKVMGNTDTTPDKVSEDADTTPKEAWEIVICGEHACAQDLYDDYKIQKKGKTFDGKQMDEWEDMDEEFTDKWESAHEVLCLIQRCNKIEL